MMSNNAQAIATRNPTERYRIERLIARGGMGAVYLATDLRVHRQVALKILTPGSDLDEDGRFEERFRLEAETLAALNHDNIVTLFDYGQTDDGRYYLALEYIDGPRYTDLLRDGPLDPEQCVSLLLQVCRALRYAHRSGKIHRDLKPSNLLIRYDEDDGSARVKVVDFGLVKVLEDDQSLTRAGLILGSPHCMSPEQIRGDEIDHRTDLYAVGVLLFRSMTGKWPFHGDTSTATMIAHINNPVPRFDDVAPGLGVAPTLEHVVRRCLSKDPNRRPADAAALMVELRAAMGADPTITMTDAEDVPLGGAPPRGPVAAPHVHLSAPLAGPTIPIQTAGRGVSATLRPLLVGALVATLLGVLVYAAWTAGRQGAALPFPASADGTTTAAALSPEASPEATSQALQSTPVPGVDPALSPAPSPSIAEGSPGASGVADPGIGTTAPAAKQPAPKKEMVRDNNKPSARPKQDTTGKAKAPESAGDDAGTDASGAPEGAPEVPVDPNEPAPDGYMGLPGDLQ
jgi:eukaryotic-like serine/threonine-protein kinase